MIPVAVPGFGRALLLAGALAASGCVVRSAVDVAGDAARAGVGVAGDAAEAGVDVVTPDGEENEDGREEKPES